MFLLMAVAVGREGTHIIARRQPNCSGFWSVTLSVIGKIPCILTSGVLGRGASSTGGVEVVEPVYAD